MQQFEQPGLPVASDLLRGARAVLGWSLMEAGRRAAVSISTVITAECRGARSSSVPSSDLDKLRRAYEDAGVNFVEEGAAGRGITIGFR